MRTRTVLRVALVSGTTGFTTLAFQATLNRRFGSCNNNIVEGSSHVGARSAYFLLSASSSSRKIIRCRDTRIFESPQDDGGGDGNTSPPAAGKDKSYSLFQDSMTDGGRDQEAQFGQVVVPKYLQNIDEKSEQDSQILSTPLATSGDNDNTSVGGEASSTPSTTTGEGGWSKNMIVAIASVSLAILQYAWQFTHPIAPLTLLAEMQDRSAPLSVIGTNGKPTVVDFWAPWCENCRLAAPILYQLEEDYQGRVNFCIVNGDLRSAGPAIQAFGVDAIPHLALVEADGTVDTALIGPVPSSYLHANLDTLLSNAKQLNQEKDAVVTPLPYTMLDVFQGRSAAGHKVHFD